MEPSSTLILSFAHVFVLLAVTALNLTLTQVRSFSANSRDSRRLRLAIRAELTEVLQLYHSNCTSLTSGQRVLLSIRPMLTLYRGSVNKLNLLAEAEIPCVVAAYATAESIESFVSATTKATGTTSYYQIKEDSPIAELLSSYTTGINRTRQALAALGERDSSIPETCSYIKLEPRDAVVSTVQS